MTLCHAERHAAAQVATCVLLFRLFHLCAPFVFQTKCFICGIGNDYFDTVPHGFETHTLQEHNLANYL